MWKTLSSHLFFLLENLVMVVLLYQFASPQVSRLQEAAGIVIYNKIKCQID